MNVRAGLAWCSYAEPRERAGHLLQHPGKIFSAERLFGCGYRIGSQHLLSRPGKSTYAAGVVDCRRHSVGYGDVHLHAEGPDDLCGQLRNQLLGELPPGGVECPKRPDDLPGPGNGVGD
jgi:hypothetical protein